MTVVSDSSPLITLAKTGLLWLFPALYERIAIPPAVHEEIVVHGAGLAGSLEIRDAEWIDVRSADRREDTDALRTRGLGAGESSALQVSASGAYLDRKILNAALRALDLPEL